MKIFQAIACSLLLSSAINLADVRPASAAPVKLNGQTVFEAREIDNSGRQLAVAIPGMCRATINLHGEPIQNPGKKSPDFLTQIKPYTDGALKLLKMAADQFYKLLLWIGSFFKPLYTGGTSTPVAHSSYTPLTPGQIASGHKVYYTREGRLKSIVHR